MEVIKDLEGIPAEALYEAFNAAFSDYARSWSRQEFDSMLKRRGFDAALSFGAFEGNQLVSFILNGIGTYNGYATAYDTGTGTLKDHRSKGLSSRLFEHALPLLKKAGITQYLLEVLQNNAQAVSLYTKAGFSITRELNYYIQEVKHLKPLPVAGLAIREIPIQTEHLQAMWEFEPAWQNNFAAIQRDSGAFTVLGAFEQNMLTGYGIIEAGTGDIPQLAVATAYRRRGIGRALFNTLLKLNKSSVIKVINSDARCESMNGFLAANGVQLSGKQYEMLLEIR